MSWTVSTPVIVPVDFSGMTVDALKIAQKIAERAELIYAVHVVSNYDHIAPGTHDLESATDEERRAFVRSNFAKYLDEHGISGVQEKVLEGDPAAEIAMFSAEQKAGLIVIPSHGYDGVKRLLLGSVAESIIREAECPVLVLRRQDAE